MNLKQSGEMIPIIPFVDVGAMTREINDELDAAWREVVSSSAFIGGHHVDLFEQQWAQWCDCRYAVGVANGTNALALTLTALGIGRGDEVILPTNTFVATAEAVVLAGAVPRFVDVDSRTLLIRGDATADAIGARTAAIVPVHLYGQMPDMEELAGIAAHAGVALIEDAAQAHGAKWNQKKAGSWGTAGCFSFYPGKNLGAFGDAGAVVTHDAQLAERIRSLADHGRSASSKYLHPIVGTNSRLDALQAAILTTKLPRLDAWNQARRDAVAAYSSRLAEDDVHFVETAAEAETVSHLNVVRVARRDQVKSVLEARGIQTGIHYPRPCHQQEAYRSFAREPLPVAESAAAEILSLPVFPHITSSQIDYVCDVLRDALHEGALAHVR